MAVVNAPTNPSSAQTDATIRQLTAISNQLSTLASSGAAQQKQLDAVNSFVTSQQTQQKEMADREQARAQAMAMFQQFQQAHQLQQQQQQPSLPSGSASLPLLMPPSTGNSLVPYNPYQPRIN